MYTALNANTSKLMTLKQVDLSRDDHKHAQQYVLRFLVVESETLKELNHPNIVRYLGYQDSSETVIVLDNFIHAHTNDRVV